jgi:small subunit ribosomal protein S12
MSKNYPKFVLSFRIRKIKKKRTKALIGSPQKKGDCIRVFKMSPKKPNSAKRSVARVLLSNKRKTSVFIPGINHNLQKHSTILVRGGRAQDLPGVNFRAVRGKFDLDRVYGRAKSRSKYGGEKIWKDRVVQED